MTGIFMLTISIVGWVVITALAVGVAFAVMVMIGMAQGIREDNKRNKEFHSHCEEAVRLANELDEARN